MAQNEVKFTVRMNDDNTIDIIAKKSRKAAKAVDELGDATKRTNTARNTYSKQEKGVGQLTSNSTKAFAKQAQTLGGTLVPAYAVLAANIFAITAAFGALKRAAEVKQLVEGFTILGNEAGRSATVISGALREVTGNAISMEQALRSSASAFSAGFKTEELLKLGEIAKNASIALGRDMGDALDRLVRGVGKLEPEILDELGIFIKIDAAAEKYAATLGKTASQLTETERRQAFLNESIAQGAVKYGFLTDKVEPTAFDQLAATFNDLAKSVINFFNTALSPLANFLATNVSALVGVLVIFGGTVLRQMVPALNDLAKGQAKAALETAKNAQAQSDAADKAAAANRKFVGAAKGAGKNTIFAKNQADIEKGTISVQKLRQSIVSLNKIITGKKNAVKQGTAEEIAAYEAEIVTLERARVAAEKLYAAQTGESPKKVAQTLSFLARAQDKLAGSTEKISSARWDEGFKIANDAMGKYYKRLLITGMKQGAFVRDTTTGKFSFLNFGKSAALGFRLASGGVRLFGAALINAIPVIGQIIFVVGLIIEQMISFFSSTEKVQRPLDRLGEVTDTVGDKVEQFNQSVKELPGLLARAGNEMSDTAMQGLILQKQLKITAGVTDEFTASFKEFGTELASSDMGVLEAIGSIVKEVFITSIREATKAIDEFKAKVIDGYLNTLKSVWGWIKETFPTAGEAIESTFTTAKNAVVDTATGIADGVSGIADGIKESGKFSQAINVARSEYEKLLEQGGFTTRFLKEEFGEGGLAGAYEDAQKRGITFAQAQAEVNARLDKANKKAQEFNSQANDLGKNYAELTQSLSKFRAKLAAKDEYQTMADQIFAQAESLQKLFTNTELGEGRFAIIEAEIAAGTLNLTEFGITLEDIRNKGGDAVKELGNLFADVAEKQRLLKETTKALKEELADLKLETEFEQASRNLNASIENLKQTGKFEVPMATLFEEQKTVYDESLALIEKEFGIKSTLIDLEYDLLDAKLAVEKAINAKNPEVLTALNAQQQVVDKARQAAQDRVQTERDIAELKAKQAFYTTQESNQQKYMQKLQTGSLMDRLKALGEGGGTKAFEDTDEQGNVIRENMAQKVAAISSVMQPMTDELKKLGPQGEYVAAVAEGAFMMTEAWAGVGDTFAASTSSMEKGAAVAGAIASTISAVAGMMSKASDARIAAIDKEIAAEQKRDGKSAASLAKIQSLEKKKEQEKRKQFEMNKKLQMAQIVASTAAAVMQTLAASNVGFFATPLAMLVAAMGAAQLAIVAGTSYDGGGTSSTGAGMPTAISMGNRQSSIDVANSRSAAGELGYMRGESGTGGPENFKATNAFAGMKYRANGGNTGIVVGEQGPELFIPDRPGRIVPSDDVQSGGTSNINFSINAIDSAGVEDVLIRQRGNIIGMIREAANSYGETFMEQVDTGQYTPSSAGARKY